MISPLSPEDYLQSHGIGFLIGPIVPDICYFVSSHLPYKGLNPNNHCKLDDLSIIKI